MNKVMLLGRLTKDPEVRYSQGSEPIAVARYTLAVNRRFKRPGEPEADFIPCVAFGKAGEFAEKFLKKGMQIAVVGRLQIRTWDDAEGKRHWSTDVVIEEQEFTESKAAFEQHQAAKPMSATPTSTTPSGDDGFYPIDSTIEDDDLPF